MIDIYYEIERLLKYSVDRKLLDKDDLIYTRNSLLGILHLNDFQERTILDEDEILLNDVLKKILDYSFLNGILKENTINNRDILDSKIMGMIIPKPTATIREFEKNYLISPKKATEAYYEFSKNSNYIRMDRINKNIHWYSPTDYGELEITINLSKPEKDPLDIIAEKELKTTFYPKCLLCKENEGYYGRLNHPSRVNLRIIPMELSGEKWYFQYSPYVYYNEHSIIFSEKHTPMKMTKETIEKLLEFTKKIPHYFVGANAELPIVGGSILSHEHFQGGNHEFPMAKAEIEIPIKFNKYEGVKAGIVRWPMSTIRINSKNKEDLLNLGNEILKKWRTYNNISLNILSETNGEPHNTITPIARRRGENYELDIVLRNNRTTSEYPLGIFHPHEDVHNIKKENIGLIEVMGVAILPGRLAEELKKLEEYIENTIKSNKRFSFESLKKYDKNLEKHWNIILEIEREYSQEELKNKEIKSILKLAVGRIFSKVLNYSGVFKSDKKGREEFQKFLNSI